MTPRSSCSCTTHAGDGRQPCSPGMHLNLIAPGPGAHARSLLVGAERSPEDSNPEVTTFEFGCYKKRK